MAPNFVQGAMQNALSIQADPTRAIGAAQTAFAGSGNLALKLTALIDAEEQQVIDNQFQEQKLDIARDEVDLGYGKLDESIRATDIDNTNTDQNHELMKTVYGNQDANAKKRIGLREQELKLSKTQGIVKELELLAGITATQTKDLKVKNQYWTDASQTKMTPEALTLDTKSQKIMGDIENYVTKSIELRLNGGVVGGKDSTVPAVGGPTLPTTPVVEDKPGITLPTPENKPSSTEIVINTTTGETTIDTKKMEKQYGQNWVEVLQVGKTIADDINKHMPLDSNGNNTRPTGENAYTSTGVGSDTRKLELVRSVVSTAYGKDLSQAYFDKETLREATKAIVMADPISYKQYKDRFLTDSEMKELGPKLLEKASLKKTGIKDYMWLANNLLQDGSITKSYLETFSMNMRGSENGKYDTQTLIQNAQDAKADKNKYSKISAEDAEAEVDALYLDDGLKVVKKAQANNSFIPFAIGMQKTIGNKALLVEINKQKFYSGFSTLQTGIKYAPNTIEGGGISGTAQTVNPDVADAARAVYGRPAPKGSKMPFSQFMKTTIMKDGGAKLQEVTEALSAREATTGHISGMPIVLSDGTKVKLSDAKKVAGLYGVMAGIAFAHEVPAEKWFIELMTGEEH